MQQKITLPKDWNKEINKIDGNVGVEFIDLCNMAKLTAGYLQIAVRTSGAERKMVMTYCVSALNQLKHSTVAMLIASSGSKKSKNMQVLYEDWIDELIKCIEQDKMIQDTLPMIRKIR